VFGPFRGASDAEMAAWLRAILTNTIADGLRRLQAGARDVYQERSLQTALEEILLAPRILARSRAVSSRRAGDPAGARAPRAYSWQTDIC